MHDKDNNIKNGDFDQKSTPDKSSRPSPTNDFGTQNSIEDMLFNILNDTASPEEFLTFKEWIKDDSHEKYFQQFKQLWNATTHASISAQEKAKAFRQYQKYILSTPHGKRHNYLRQIPKYAAIIIFSLSIGYYLATQQESPVQPLPSAQIQHFQSPTLIRADGSIINLITTDTTLQEKDGTQLHRSGDRQIRYQKNNSVATQEIYNTLNIPRGERFNITLADGTKVWLNSESSLIFPVNFVGKERVVQLTGQAYFEVQKDSLHPFIVKSRNLETRVLGTSFDICSYPDMAETSIILVEGCIQATAYHRKAILHADQQLTLDTLQQKMSITDIDAKLMTQWKDGILRLDNQNFNEMLDKLSRLYGITFVNNASIDSSDRFNGKFHREDIQEAMHIISLSANITYTIKQDTIFIHPK